MVESQSEVWTGSKDGVHTTVRMRASGASEHDTSLSLKWVGCVVRGNEAFTLMVTLVTVLPSHFIST